MRHDNFYMNNQHIWVLFIVVVEYDRIVWMCMCVLMSVSVCVYGMVCYCFRCCCCCCCCCLGRVAYVAAAQCFFLQFIVVLLRFCGIRLACVIIFGIDKCAIVLLYGYMNMWYITHLSIVGMHSTLINESLHCTAYIHYTYEDSFIHWSGAFNFRVIIAV